MKRLLIFVGVAAVIALLAVGAAYAFQQLRDDDPDLAKEAPQIPTATGGTATNNAAGAGSGVRKFVIEPSESSAKYVVEETLRGLNSTAVGTSSAITGEIYLTSEGLSSDTPSRFVVDLNALRSDEGMRDNYIKQNTLQTSRFPNAEFVIESIEGFPSNYTGDNSQVQLTLHGNLTVKDVTRPVSWTVLARQSGNTLAATADTDIKFSQFNMTPPTVPIATVRDDIHVQVVLVAREPASWQR
jgi:polyisoprenoid-binding protein YceI